MKLEIVTSKQNAALVHVRKLLRSSAYRRETGEYAAEGPKLLQEALRWKAQVTTVIVSEGLPCPEADDSVRWIQIPEALMKQLSLQEQPQGAVFICRIPEAADREVRPGSVILDGIQDPGNLGTMIRTADALEVPLFLSDGCADPYNPKTVRAAMGALFRSPPVRIRQERIVESCRRQSIPLIATALTPAARDIREVLLGDGAVLIGSEGQGVCPALLQAADQAVVIPMNPRCESLNAATAAAIVMWQMKQER